MSTMQHEVLPVNPDPSTWPDWTDNWHWVADPLPSDADWAAREFNADDDDDQGVDEHAALEASALDSIERGLIPRDLAEDLARTSLVGLADEMTASYADEEERITGARPSNEVAARNLAIASFRMGHMA